jgi:hypothetical protein
MLEVSKELLEKLLFHDRLMIKDIARELKVHRNTVSKWIKEFDIDTRMWWYHRPIACTECGKEIDSKRELPEKRRKNLLARKILRCESCKKEVARRQNREKAQRFRDKNRDYYNFYMREYRKKRKESES